MIWYIWCDLITLVLRPRLGWLCTGLTFWFLNYVGFVWGKKFPWTLWQWCWMFIFGLFPSFLFLVSSITHLLLQLSDRHLLIKLSAWNVIHWFSLRKQSFFFKFSEGDLCRTFFPCPLDFLQPHSALFVMYSITEKQGWLERL